MTERFVELTVLPNEAIAATVRDALDEAEIAARYEPAYDRVPAFGVSVGTPVRVKVREFDLDRAHEALASAQNAGEAIEWDEVDLGEAEDPEAAAIAARRPVSMAEWEAAEELRRARRLRRYGVALIVFAVGCAVAFAGAPQVLAVLLVVGAVWLGREHAISRRRKQIERILRAEAGERVAGD